MRTFTLVGKACAGVILGATLAIAPATAAEGPSGLLQLAERRDYCANCGTVTKIKRTSASRRKVTPTASAWSRAR
jgi:hypothetical protein